MPCEIRTTRRFRKRIAGRETEVLAILRQMQSGFGQPHLHTGLGIRKLAPDLFECRMDLKTRLVFTAEKGVLTFDFAGNHGEVQSYLRGKR